MILHELSFTYSGKTAMEQAGMKFVRLDNTGDPTLAMYRILDSEGEVIMDSVAEEFDDPQAWNARSEEERKALMILARDAQYGLQWDK